jgi:serine phosphatase RsbU (regulator of sigma subunit)
MQELDRARRRLAAQVAAAERIGTTLDIDVTCDELAEFTVPAMSDLTLVEVLPYEIAERGDGAGAAPPRMHRAAFACTPAVRRLLGSSHALGEPTRSAAESAVGRSLRAGGPVVANLPSAQELELLAGNAEDLAAFRLLGVDSILAVPLVARGRVIGALTMARVGAEHRGFTEDDMILAQDLADRAAVSVESARQYAESQRITLELQRALLVEPGPPHSNLEIAARHLPLGRRNLVGGDWYEIIRLPFGRTLLVMADVMGHGMEAAVDMSHYRSIIRELGSMDLPPHGILAHLDTVIAASESARPATCLLAVADPSRRRWTLASAGHLPPALFVAGRPTELIPTPIGPPLGTGVGGYEHVTVDLLPDQILLLYTDGLVERRGEDIDISLARLAAVDFPPTGELEQLLQVVLSALASSTPDDDIAVLAARANPRQD